MFLLVFFSCKNTTEAYAHVHVYQATPTFTLCGPGSLDRTKKNVNTNTTKRMNRIISIDITSYRESLEFLRGMR